MLEQLQLDRTKILNSTFVSVGTTISFMLLAVALTQLRFLLEQFVFDRNFVSAINESVQYFFCYTKLIVRWSTSTIFGACTSFCIATAVFVIQHLELHYQIVAVSVPLAFIGLYLLIETISTRKRRIQPELIDLGKYNIEEYLECVGQMADICYATGADVSFSSSTAFGRFVKEFGQPESVLDVGCGGGWLSMYIGSMFPNARVTGIDLNEKAIDYAKTMKEMKYKKTGDKRFNNISFRATERAELCEPPKSVDVVTCSMMCHHIPDDEQIIDFLKIAGNVARKAVIICDLERSALGLLAYKVFVNPLFSNRLILHDGALSVRRSFTYDEWVNYLRKAGYKDDQFKVSYCPVHRFSVYINVSNNR